jgi:hypothetical protein
MTLKAAVICLDSEEECALIQTWLDMTNARRVSRPEGPRLSLREVCEAAAMTSAGPRRCFELIVRTTEVGTPEMPRYGEPLPTPSWYRRDDIRTLTDLLQKTVPTQAPPLALDPDAIAMRLLELERTLGAGMVDRRRAAWLWLEADGSPRVDLEMRPMIWSVLGWSVDLAEPRATVEGVAELRARFSRGNDSMKHESEVVGHAEAAPQELAQPMPDALKDRVAPVVLRGAQLPDIELVVTDIELVVIAPSGERKVPYENLGFTGNGGRAPGRRWDLLRDLARNGGTLSTDSLARQERNALSQRVTAVNRALGQLLGVAGNERLITDVRGGYRCKVRMRLDDPDDRP